MRAFWGPGGGPLQQSERRLLAPWLFGWTAVPGRSIGLKRVVIPTHLEVLSHVESV